MGADLFARKFDATEDSKILDILERHLTTPLAMKYALRTDRIVVAKPQVPGGEKLIEAVAA